MASMGTWIERRLPIQAFFRTHLCEYYAPKNLNFWYVFGVFSLVVLVNQMLTGIWLVMHYTPTADEAFASVEHIMRHVHFGWLFRYLHAVGASAFFVVVYLHMFRALLYGSYKTPRELIWLTGCVMFILLMSEAFTGYVLPWGQMSYWGTKVIVSLFTVIPWVGQSIAVWLQGDYVVSGVTLHRFFAFHVIAVPLVIVALVGLHIVVLHCVGSNNPEGIEICDTVDAKGRPLDGIAFHPYYTVKDCFAVALFLLVFLWVVFFSPTLHGWFLEADNFLLADPMVTPLHVKPLWYFSPFYTMLRAVPSKLLGAIVMAVAVMILFALPWLDRSPVKSMRYKGRYSHIALSVFVVAFIGLGVLGAFPATTTYVWISRLLTMAYFMFFLLMPWYTRMEVTRSVPTRIKDRT